MSRKCLKQILAFCILRKINDNIRDFPSIGVLRSDCDKDLFQSATILGLAANIEMRISRGPQLIEQWVPILFFSLCVFPINESSCHCVFETAFEF